MKIYETFLFDGTEKKDALKTAKCFGIYECGFEPGETVCDYRKNTGKIGIVLSGRVLLSRSDSAGNRVVLEMLFENDVFGEPVPFFNNPERDVYAVCEKSCRVAFFEYENIAKRCKNACACHTRAVENMLSKMGKKANALSERIEVLSSRTIREKLLCCFRIYAEQKGSAAFELPFSLSYLADYICADRSAMMRELKKMSDEKLIKTDRRKIELLIRE